MLGCQGVCHRRSILIIQKRNPRQISSKTKIKCRSLWWRFNQHASNIKRKFYEKIRATLRLLCTFEEISAEVLWSVCQNPPRFLLCTVCLLKKGQNHMLKNKKKHRGTWYGCRMHCFMLCEQQQKKSESSGLWKLSIATMPSVLMQVLSFLKGTPMGSLGKKVQP